jgi:hypothetical protein
MSDVKENIKIRRGTADEVDRFQTTIPERLNFWQCSRVRCSNCLCMCLPHTVASTPDGLAHVDN